MRAEPLDCLVIGAGVIGLAVAREFALQGREVVVVDAEPGIGRHTSSRNSEVIHSGIYYPPGSLKARLCVAGRERLYRYCRERDVAHRNLGKLIVAATEGELQTLARYRGLAEANGAGPVRELSADDVRRLEPAVRCVGALHVPVTGIIDSHAYLQALRVDLEASRGIVVLRNRVEGGDVSGGALRVRLRDDTGPVECVATTIVNAAGLQAPQLCRSIAGFPQAAIPQAYFAKGHYYALDGGAPCTRLIYPIATRASLGVHLTLDLAGRARFGPDVEWVDGIDYRFDDTRRDAFAAAVKAYLPDLDLGRLHPGYTGIRPKIVGPGAPPGDFRIDGVEVHGIAGWINLFGIESPGLTASLAIGEYVAARCQR